MALRSSCLVVVVGVVACSKALVPASPEVVMDLGQSCGEPMAAPYRHASCVDGARCALMARGDPDAGPLPSDGTYEEVGICASVCSEGTTCPAGFHCGHATTELGDETLCLRDCSDHGACGDRYLACFQGGCQVFRCGLAGGCPDGYSCIAGICERPTVAKPPS